MVVLGGDVVSYERGTPIGFKVQGSPGTSGAGDSGSTAPASTRTLITSVWFCGLRVEG